VATAKVKPGARPYLGNADGPATGPRAGMNEFIKQVQWHSGGALWNNGSYMRRDMKGKPGSLSVHATGRAVDLSYRGSARRPQASRQAAMPIIKKLVQNANELGIEMVIDYMPNRLVEHGAVIGKHGRNTASQQLAVHLAATGSTLRSHHKLPTR
jgi:hypothetical protein